jgi:type IV pilus assembly protein PilA
MRAAGIKGFTLIELLVVVAIIGILAAIAIPQFAAYRQKGFDARAETDLRHFAIAEEAYFIGHDVYMSTSCNATGKAAGVQNTDLHITCSAGVNLTIAAGPGAFTGTAVHDAGAYVWSYDSAHGGFPAPTLR